MIVFIWRNEYPGLNDAERLQMMADYLSEAFESADKLSLMED